MTTYRVILAIACLWFIYQKLDARDRTQAVLQAVRMGIVSLE